jgi:DNA-binding NtrC family response regulator
VVAGRTAAASGGAVQILVVEDDPAVARVLVDLLTDEGPTVLHAATLAAVRHPLQSACWDVCLADCLGGYSPQPHPTDLALLQELAVVAPVVLGSAQSWARAVAAVSGPPSRRGRPERLRRG